MITIKENYPLDSLNTFHIAVSARFFATIKSRADIEELTSMPEFKNTPKLILGGGSNILFTRNFEGLIIYSKINDINVITNTNKEVLVRVGNGIVWDDFVEWCVKNNCGGAENLSAIPGTVGATPVQNIGAYGVEAKDIIEQVEGLDLNSGAYRVFLNKECEFAYRNSIFKTRYLNRYFVTHVTFRLSKAPHTLITHYGTIEEELNKTGDYSIGGLRQVITKIRNNKLPDVDKYGNAGSFFKNPVISGSRAKALLEQYPDMPMYPVHDACMKLSAAWLIDKAGLKGFSAGNAATHIGQPLVIINKGNASGDDILNLAQHIQKTINNTFGVLLEPEVNIY